jgi:hypothetical protein
MVLGALVLVAVLVAVVVMGRNLRIAQGFVNGFSRVK